MKLQRTIITKTSELLNTKYTEVNGFLNFCTIKAKLLLDYWLKKSLPESLMTHSPITWGHQPS